MKKRVLNLIIMFLVPAAQATLQADIVTQYSFENNLLDTAPGGAATDNLKLVGAPVTFEAGIIGQALRTEGGTMLNVVQSEDVAMSECKTYTIEAFIKPDDKMGKDINIIITNWTSATSGPYYIATFTGSSIGAFLGDADKNDVDLRKSAPCAWNAWQHIALTVGETHASFWHNGQLVKSQPYNGTHIDGLVNPNGLKIIGSNLSNAASFIGLIDEVIFHHEEKNAVYMLSRAALVNPAIRSMSEVCQNAQVLIKQNKPQEAISMLERETQKCELWKENCPLLFRTSYQKVAGDMYCLWAQAQEAAGTSKESVAAAYEQVMAAGLPSSLSYASALLWHFENVTFPKYAAIIGSLLDNNSDYLKGVIAKAEEMMAKQQAKAAIEFLEGNLSAYAQWQNAHPFNDVAVKESISGAYYTLAQARAATNAPKDEIADAYFKTFTPLSEAHKKERAAALAWLLQNKRAKEIREIFNTFALTKNISPHIQIVIREVCRNYKLSKDWSAFQSFLDTLFSQAKYPYEWVAFLETCFADDLNSRWAKTFIEYCENNPSLKFDRDRYQAEKYEAEDKFLPAAEIYQSLINQCEQKIDKGLYQFRCCFCFYHAGEYDRAVSMLDNFIKEYKATHRSLIQEAFLLKGQAYIQLGEVDKASECFLGLLIEFPRFEKTADANFFVGYCYMLQSKYKLALEAFKSVVKDYPESSCALKANLMIKRIEDIIGEGAKK